MPSRQRKTEADRVCQELETLNSIPEYVSRCLQLALLLEVSAYPKPGNVHRTADFSETKYEHFLASAVAVGSHFLCAAVRGARLADGTTSLQQIGMGKIIKDATSDTLSWQRGKNTLLGSIILLTPMAVVAGQTLAANSCFSNVEFRKNLKSVVESTTPNDAAYLYDAITLAQPGGLGKVPTLDVTEAESRQRILDEGISLYEVFKISSSWDSIAYEWISNYHITFDIGYEYLRRRLETRVNLNTGIVHTFLKVLSEVPDTLIARKVGKQKAQSVSTKAEKILKAGGLTTGEGKRRLLDFDAELRDPYHTLNPGTTADLTSAILAIAILNGYRP